jgi:hypothetical protein
VAGAPGQPQVSAASPPEVLLAVAQARLNSSGRDALVDLGDEIGDVRRRYLAEMADRPERPRRGRLSRLIARLQRRSADQAADAPAQPPISPSSPPEELLAAARMKLSYSGREPLEELADEVEDVRRRCLAEAADPAKRP